MDTKLNQLLQLCINDHIPNMRPKTLQFLYDCFDNYKDVLIFEVGTAYGYSSMFLLKHKNIKHIDTIEKDKVRFSIAKKWLSSNSKISIINDSIFDYNIENFYDCLIIDGPKSHQDLIFDKCIKNLKDNGFIFIDNLNLFSGKSKNELSKNQKKLIIKVQKFKDKIMNLDKNIWNVKFYDIEDGFCKITKKI